MSDIQEATSASTVSFKTALVFNAIVFGAELAAFTILRPRFKAIYEPRTYVPSQNKRADPMSSSLFSWPLAIWKMDYRGIIQANGMDAYFFVRFLRMAVKVFLPIWIVSWVVLMPVTSVGTSAPGNDGLNRFTFGNIGKSDQTRYAAHIILVYFFTFWIFYNIKTEMSHFTIERQKYLISAAHSKSAQANTVLITGIPTKYLKQRQIHNLFNGLPGGVKKIWINRDLKELPEVYERRLKACNKLESAETKLLSMAAKLRLKKQQTDSKNPKTSDVEGGDVAAASAIVPPNKRPSHKLGFLGLFGEKVDSIDWARKEIHECNQLLEEGKATIDRENQDEGVDDSVEEGSEKQHGVAQAKAALLKSKDKMAAIIPGGKGQSTESYPPLSSAFVLFNRQISAHLAAQALTHHEPYRMSERHLEVSPEDVIWSNLGLNPYERKIRIAISWALTLGLIILWSFPVAFIGALSNVPKLVDTYHWLSFINKIPPIVQGIISGILPPVLLAVLMMLLPIVLRLFAKFEGIPKYTGLELSLMSRYFIFLVIHSFLIVTLSSGIIAALPQIANNPASVASLLAQNLPQASIFFLTYVILQGLSGAAGSFLQIAPLAIYYVKLFLLGSTPRSVHGIKFTLRSVAWGTLFPGITLLIVITLGYSIIAPIINGLACATFFLFYQLYKYLFLYQFGQTPDSDTGGLFFPKAIQHVFVGLYVQQICLAALFFLAQDNNSKQSAIPEGALMVVLIICTVGFHLVINNSYGPLIHALPLSLSDKTWGAETPESRSNGDSIEMARQSTQGVRPSTDDENRHILRQPPQQPTTTALEGEGDSKHPAGPGAGVAGAPRDADAEFADYGFAHPAVSRPQRVVWLPRDENGFVEEEEKGCHEAGVQTSTKNAVMNEKGKVDVDGSPPDEED